MTKFSRITVLCLYLFASFAPAFVFAQQGTAERIIGTPSAIDTSDDKLSLEDIRNRQIAQAAGSVTAARGFGGQMGVAIGVGFIVIGGGMGIGIIGSSALSALSRQPELAGKIQTAMIIAAALIEGVTLLALIICILCLFM